MNRSKQRSPHRDDLVTLYEAVAITGFSRRTLQRYIAAGRLQAYRHGDKYVRVRRSDLDALIKPM